MPVSKKRKTKKKKKNKKPLTHQSLQTATYSKLKQKITDIGIDATIYVNKTKEKVSGLILDYGKDFVSPDYEQSFNRKMIALLITCWNIGLRIESAEEQTRQVIETLKIEDEEMKNLIKMLVARKIMLYGQYKYFVIEYDLSFPNGALQLSVGAKELD